METTIAQFISENIKQLREMRGLTQNQLSVASGIPRPTWAHLESGAANPSVTLLLKVAATLQVSIEELISPPRSALKYYRAADLETRKRGDVTIRKLLPDSIQNIDLERLELPVGARMGGIPHRSGTREYLTCESGEIELTVSGEKWKLAPGDVVVFRGDQRHSYHNPGKQPAVGYSIVLLG